MALLGITSAEVQANAVDNMITTEVESEANLWADIEESKKDKAKAAVAAVAPQEGENMEGEDEEKDEQENVPDVSVDDETDPNLKPFFIVLKTKGNRKAFMSKEKIGIDRVAKIKVNPHPRNSVFLFDKRSKTIRLASERNFVLSNKMDKGLKQGHKAVFRRIMNATVQPDQVLTIGAKNI